jgi:hypothetical protein
MLGKTATEKLQLLRDATAMMLYLGLKIRAKIAATEYRGYSNGCDDGAQRHAERGIRRMLSGVTQMLATVY